MQQLENLVRAQALSRRRPGSPCVGTAVLGAEETEVARVMQICNACRYCEGFCAVFPAMTRRLEFGKADVNYLANLCHCGACLHACTRHRTSSPSTCRDGQGARADLPTMPGRRRWAGWPRHGLVLSLAVAAGIALFLALAAVMVGGLFHEPWPAISVPCFRTTRWR